VSRAAGGAIAERQSIRAEPSRVVMRKQCYMPPAVNGQRGIKTSRTHEDKANRICFSVTCFCGCIVADTVF